MKNIYSYCFKGIILSILSLLTSACSVLAQNQTGTLTVQWSANTEDDLGGYRVYYGLASRQYDYMIDVGNVTSYQLSQLNPGKEYYIALTAYDINGNESDFSEEVSAVPDTSTSSGSGTPNVFILYQNYPNPFNPITTIPYYLAEDCHARVTIYNTKGSIVRVLVDTDQLAGFHQTVWDSKDQFGVAVSSGVYFVQLQTEHFSLSRQMVIFR